MMPFDAGSCLIVPPQISTVQRIHTPFRIAHFHFDIAYQGEILRDARPFVGATANGSLAMTLPGVPASRPIIESEARM